MRPQSSHVLSALVLLLLLVGCTSTKELSLTEPVSEGSASISLGLTLSDHSCPSPLLRADDDIWYDKSRTYLINGLRIVLYKQDSEGNPSEVAYAFDRDVFSFRDKRSGEDLLNPEDTGSLFKIKGIGGITPDDYSIILITSPSQAIKEATTVGQSYEELRKPLGVDFIGTMPGGTEPLSVASPIYSTATNIESPARVTKEELSKSNTTPLDLGPISLKSVDGMVVIRSQYDMQKQDEELGLHIMGGHIFYPDVLNKSLLLFPEKDTSAEGDLMVPIDQNYSGMKDWSDDRLAQEFSYIGTTIEPNTMSIYGYTTSNDGTGMSEPMVIPENTTAPADARSRVVTHVVAGISVRPTSFENLPDPKEDYTGSWFTYEGKNYDFVTFANTYNDACKRLQGVNGDLSALTKPDQDIILMGKDVLLACYPEKEVSIGDRISEAPGAGASSDKVKIYSRGRAFYLIPIRHFDDTLAPSVDDIGRYGVVRNTLYQITIRSVEHIGAPTMGTLPKDIDYTTIVPGDVTIGLSDRVVIDNNVSL